MLEREQKSLIVIHDPFPLSRESVRYAEENILYPSMGNDELVEAGQQVFDCLWEVNPEVSRYIHKRICTSTNPGQVIPGYRLGVATTMTALQEEAMRRGGRLPMIAQSVIDTYDTTYYTNVSSTGVTLPKFQDLFRPDANEQYFAQLQQGIIGNLHGTLERRYAITMGSLDIYNLYQENKEFQLRRMMK